MFIHLRNFPPLDPFPVALDEWLGRWVAAQSLSASDLDCATTVMLKILDGKCKMKPLEKTLMTALYDQVKHRASEQMGADLHAMIAQYRGELSEADKERVYELRVLAETRISRPVMKAFKARIREQGLFRLPPDLLQWLAEEDSE
ncbi:MAG: hypothetical protein VYA55_18935 [Pseudomonadota bacterium]|nr:hypothetical protein [Pseudomonadota bacterium]